MTEYLMILGRGFDSHRLHQANGPMGGIVDLEGWANQHFKEVKMARKRKQNEEIEENKGKPWKNIAQFNNFCDADKKRIKLLSENDKIQVKVKRAGDCGLKFVVKLRKNPLFEEKNEKKGKKKGKNKGARQ